MAARQAGPYTANKSLMLFDFQDYRPDTPRVLSPISVREGILLSLVAHLAFLIFILLAPKDLFQSEPQAVVPIQRQQAPLRFVEAIPVIDRRATPIRPADQSDLDRRSATLERPREADNPMPMMRGNTPELVEGGPRAAAAAPAPPTPPQPDAESMPLPPSASGSAAAPVITVETPPAPPRAASSGLGDSLRNLQQYLRDERYDNPTGGLADQSADIQFDSMGVDFGPWLRRFKNQVERNWLIPQAAMSFRGRVVIQFHVLRNGTITDLAIKQPAGIPSLTTSALNALKLSNPTTALPTEYPAEKVFFTVTFHYNENPRYPQ